MTIGPIQLIVLGFDRPNFKGEVMAEFDWLKDNDVVRVIDGLLVSKDANGEVTTIKRSDLSGKDAAEFGAVVGALIGLGAAGLEGAEAGAEIGAAATEEGVDIFDEERGGVGGSDSSYPWRISTCDCCGSHTCFPIRPRAGSCSAATT